LLIATTFNSLKKRWGRFALSVCFFTFVALQLVFFYQYFNGIIHPYSMSSERFAAIFLKTSDKYRGLFKSDPEDFYHPHGVRTVDSLFYTLTDTNFVPASGFIVNKKNIVPGQYLKAAEPQGYSYEIVTDSSWLSRTRYAEIDFDYMQLTADSAASNTLSFVTTSLLKSKGFFYNAYPVADRIFNTAGVWRHDFERMPVTAPEHPGDVIRIYMENKIQKDLCIKNLSIKIVEPKS
jgi:hypothetical protein